MIVKMIEETREEIEDIINIEEPIRKKLKNMKLNKKLKKKNLNLNLKLKQKVLRLI